jgi:hypothetical protein
MEQQYKPGDVANGHILGNDGQWVPLPPNGPKQKKSVWGRWYMIVAYVVIGLIIIGNIAGGDDAKPASADAKVEAPAKSEPKAAEPAPASDEPVAEESSPSPKPKPKPEPKALAVSAQQMLNEFEGNEAAADAKYKGKTLKITGIVEKVDTEFLDDDQYVIQLADGGDFVLWTVNCNDMSGKEAAKVQKGQKVSVIGEFDDGGDLGVEIKDCSLA